MDGRSAAVRPVRIVYDGLFLLAFSLDDGRELARWKVTQIRAEAIQERDIVHLQTLEDPDAILSVRGVDTLEQLAELGIATRGLTRSASRRVVQASLWVAGIAGLATLVWIYVQPLSRAVAKRIPLEVERDWAGGVEERLKPAYCESDAASEALSQLSIRLLGEGHELPPVHILNLEVPNAFAFPGGTVLLTRGLIELAEVPDEIAGVLAHELEHVKQRHVMAGIVRGALLSTLWAVSVGDFTGMMIIDPSTMFQIATLKFSREDEAEADRGAVEMLSRARIDSAGFAGFFARIEKEEVGLSEWFSSHPASGDRAKAVVASSGREHASRPALSPESWQAVVKACQDAPAPELGLRDLLF